jgi:hypothetical protein
MPSASLRPDDRMTLNATASCAAARRPLHRPARDAMPLVFGMAFSLCGLLLLSVAALAALTLAAGLVVSGPRCFTKSSRVASCVRRSPWARAVGLSSRRRRRLPSVTTRGVSRLPHGQSSIAWASTSRSWPSASSGMSAVGMAQPGPWSIAA